MWGGGGETPSSASESSPRGLCVFIFSPREHVFAQLHGLQQEGKYISCKVTKGVFFWRFQVTSPPVCNRKRRLRAAMGQRAALLLSELLLLLTASCTLLAVSFPEDSAPLDVVDAHCE